MKKQNRVPSPQPSTLNPQPRLSLLAFTSLGFAISRLIDDPDAPDISYDALFSAAADLRLIAFLRACYNDPVSFSSDPNKETLPQIEAALRDAAAGWDGRVGPETSPRSGLVMVMNIIFEAIQQQFHRPPSRSCATRDENPGAPKRGILMKLPSPACRAGAWRRRILFILRALGPTRTY